MTALPPDEPAGIAPAPDAWARRSTLGMGLGALASKGLGFAREVVLARFFGTGPVADAYRSALTFTLSPAHLLSTHAVQTCFIPLYTRLRTENRPRATALYQGLLLVFLAVGLLLAVALYAGAGALARVLLPGFDPERRELTAAMLRIMAPGVPAYIYCTLLASLGAGQRDYALPTIRPGLQNLGLLLMIAIAVGARRPVLAAWGFTLTYLVLSAGGTWLLHARGLLPKQWQLIRSEVASLARTYWRPLRPLLLLSVLVQGNILVERLLASLVGGGTIAAMDYARFILESTHALLLMPLGLVSLARFAGLGERELRETADRVLGLMMLLLVPVSAFLAFSGGPLIQALYQRGAFDQLSQAMTQRAMLGLGAGLWAVSASYFLRSVLHARMDNGTVLRGETIAVALNVAFVLLTYRRLGILALGLGPSLGALGSLAFYFVRLRFRAPRAPGRLLLLLAGVPFHAVLVAAIRSRLTGTWPAAVAQLLLAGTFWAIWIGAWRPLRAAAREGWRRGNRGTDR